MFKKYRALAVTAVAFVYAIAAAIFPDVLLPSQESVVAIIDAVVEAFPTEGAPNMSRASGVFEPAENLMRQT